MRQIPNDERAIIEQLKRLIHQAQSAIHMIELNGLIHDPNYTEPGMAREHFRIGDFVIKELPPYTKDMLHEPARR